MRLFGLTGRYRLLVSILAAGGMLAGIAWGLEVNGPDIRYVSVAGDINTSQRKEIYDRVSRLDRMTDIHTVKESLEQLDWVHHVDVRRDWPNGLVINVHDEEAIAWWNDNAWINDEGHVFDSPYEQGGRLPQLYGPEGEEKTVMFEYQQLSQALLRTGQSIDTLVLDARGSWAFTTRSGLEVRLGKDDIMERMQRYFQVFQQAGLMEDISKIRSVDTRYSNGVAVDWKDTMDGYEVAKAYKSQREINL